MEMVSKAGKLRALDSITMTVALAMTALTHTEIAPLIAWDKPLLSPQERNRAQARFWLDLLAPATPARESSSQGKGNCSEFPISKEAS